MSSIMLASDSPSIGLFMNAESFNLLLRICNNYRMHACLTPTPAKWTLPSQGYKMFDWRINLKSPGRYSVHVKVGPLNLEFKM